MGSLLSSLDGPRDQLTTSISESTPLDKRKKQRKWSKEGFNPLSGIFLYEIRHPDLNFSSLFTISFDSCQQRPNRFNDTVEGTSTYNVKPQFRSRRKTVSFSGVKNINTEIKCKHNTNIYLQ